MGLYMVLGSFIAVWIPYLVGLSALHVFYGQYTCPIGYVYMLEIGQLLEYSVPAIHVLIYGLATTQFRRAYATLLGCYKKEKDSAGESSTRFTNNA